MARIRSIHPGLFTDTQFVSCSLAARMLFVGILTECDDQGLFLWKPLQLKMRLLPADNADVTALLGELVHHGRVMEYAIDGGRYGAVRNFCKWQRPKSPQNLYPFDDQVSRFVAMNFKDAETVQDRGTALARILCDQQQNKCCYCETEITFYRKKHNSCEIDHRTPVSRGGEDVLANLAAACKPCNSLKATMTEAEFRLKFSPSELCERHANGGSRQAIIPFARPESSHSPPNEGVATPEKPIAPPEGEIPPQMEEGGDKMKEEGGRKKEPPSLRDVPPAVERTASAASRGSRLPDDWLADFPEIEFARSLGFSSDQIAQIQASFRDFWHAKPGAAAKKLDWRATWRNWCRKEAERLPQPARPGRLTQAFSQLDDMIANLDFAHDAPDLLQ